MFILPGVFMRLLRLDDSVCSILIFVAPASREVLSPVCLVFPPQSVPQAGRHYHVPTNDPCSRGALTIVERGLAWNDCVCILIFFFSHAYSIYPPFYGDPSARLLFLFSYLSPYLSVLSSTFLPPLI